MAPYKRRRDQLRRLVKKAGADALLVTNFTNVNYLTGFTGDDSYLVVMPATEVVLLTDGRYTTQLAEECPDLELLVRSTTQKMVDVIEKVVKRAKIGKLAFESASMTVGQRDAIAERLPKTELVPTAGLVEQLRIIKDREEIAQIRKAVLLAERAFEVIRASLRPDQTEREVAYALEQQIRLFGGEGCSFPPIVAAGPRAALPHARATTGRIGDADLLLIDWGAVTEGYVSDLTRVLVTGKISPKLEKIYGVVLTAQQRAIEAIRPGRPLEEIDAAARSVIEKAGFGRQFNHGLGHGIGLNVHEAPRLASNQKEPLQAGMVVTVEPGIYLPGWGGVRIEDDILVTRDGHEVLSRVPKQLAECVAG